MIPVAKSPTPGTRKEAVRFFYDIPKPQMADRYLGELADDDSPPEVRSLGRTLTRWRTQIINWHRARASNGPAEALTTLSNWDHGDIRTEGTVVNITMGLLA